VLDQLFSASMEQSNMRIDAPHNLAIKFQDEAQNAMCRGGCGPKFIVKFRVKASAIVASTTARPTHWRLVGFYPTAPTGQKFGSRAYVS
jgi:hypothetical protein